MAVLAQYPRASFHGFVVISVSVLHIFRALCLRIPHTLWHFLFTDVLPHDTSPTLVPLFPLLSDMAVLRCTFIRYTLYSVEFSLRWRRWRYPRGGTRWASIIEGLAWSGVEQKHHEAYCFLFFSLLSYCQKRVYVMLDGWDDTRSFFIFDSLRIYDLHIL